MNTTERTELPGSEAYEIFVGNQVSPRAFVKGYESVEIAVESYIVDSWVAEEEAPSWLRRVLIRYIERSLNEVF